MAALFVFYIHYVRLHLLTEQHLSHGLISTHSADSHLDGHGHAEHGDDGHHLPHPASEHAIQILPKSGSFTVWLACLPTATCSFVEQPGRNVIFWFPEPFHFDRGKSVHPRQPRAPPVV